MFNRIAEQYRNRTAVVIGAGGIGGEISRFLSSQVARLVVADRDPKLLARIAGPGVGSAQITTRTLDVQDGQGVADFFRFVQTTVGTPDFLFYTAGILNIESFAETSDEIWNRAVNVNLNGAFYCTKGAADLMRPAGKGSILLLASISGTKARSGTRVNPVYNTTKAGLVALVNATAMQLRPFGVRINCISPGPTSTAMMDVQPPQVHSAVGEISLDGRMNNPTEVAELALFVAAHGRFTGEDLGMGGGAGLGG
ncbi:MAG: SDR family NAD(P)-dependent oxidoreductase [Planctomycetota bacterium]|nr:SDR family NAD(P)-dependent oxidoreductase [Planctomycetota bacterium]